MNNHTCTKKKGTMMTGVAIVVAVLIIGGIIISKRGGDTPSVASVTNGVKNVASDAAQVTAEATNKVSDVTADAAKSAAEKVTDVAQDGADMMEDGMEKMDDMTAGAGKYVAYSPELVGTNKRTILNFSATWCPSCQVFDKDVTANNSEIPAGVTVLKVDYDTNKDLRKQYNVRSQHTFVEVGKDGTALKTVVGTADLTALISDFAL